LDADRRYRIPWLDRARPLSGCKVLEVGCGTGSSTVALAEQGANVVAIDIDDLAMSDAKTRCETYGLRVDFANCSATDAARLFSGERFDLIVFWACLEHMTLAERLRSMADSWAMLPSGGLWCVVDTPNRLWFHDYHTSWLPFVMWLPDELAIEYTRFSPRQRLREDFADKDDQEDRALRFARWGRGMSFHEFSVAIGPAEKLDVVSSRPVCQRNERLLARLKWGLSRKRRHEACLRSYARNLHAGFFQPDLDLILRKP
jgi:S-adenosylmethionine-dependent methyltransferase